MGRSAKITGQIMEKERKGGERKFKGTLKSQLLLLDTIFFSNLKKGTTLGKRVDQEDR